MERRGARETRWALLPGLLRTHLAASALLVMGCGPGALRSGSPARTPARAAEPVEVRRVAPRPRLVTVRREGDPLGAVGFAFALEGGAAASHALATLLERRTAALSPPLRFTFRATGLGVHGACDADSPAVAARCVEGVLDALELPVAATDPAQAEARARLRALPTGALPPALEWLARCSGERLPWRSPPEVDVEQIRLAARDPAFAAVAAVGPPGMLAAVEAAHARRGAWPVSRPRRPAWPDRDQTVWSAEPGPPRASLALWLPEATGSERLAEALRSPGSALGQRLEAVGPGWHLGRVASTFWPEGACLRVDAEGPPTTGAAAEARVAARVLLQEVAAARHGAPPSLLPGSADPRLAAAWAAWRVLSTVASHGTERRIVVLRASVPGETAALSALEPPAHPPEVRVKVEAGQPQLHLLVASPCGTRDEALPGLHALLTAALARRSAAGGLSAEPWVTPGASGLLVSVTRASHLKDGALDQLARQLSLLFAGSRFTAGELALAHAALLADRAPEPEAWAALVEQLTGGRPGLLQAPRVRPVLGTLPPEDVEGARRRWVRGPLRVAVLAGTARESQVLGERLAHWLAPFRAEPPPPCAPRPRLPPPAQRRLEVPRGADEPDALLAVALPEPTRTVEARALAHWLAATPGPLLRAFEDTRLGKAAAAVVGDEAARYLVVELRGATDVEGALAQLRGLLARLPEAWTPGALVPLARELSLLDLEERLDPRRRLADLFHAGLPAQLDEGRFLELLRAVASSRAHLVRVVRRSSPAAEPGAR